MNHTNNAISVSLPFKHGTVCSVPICGGLSTYDTLSLVLLVLSCNIPVPKVT